MSDVALKRLATYASTDAYNNDEFVSMSDLLELYGVDIIAFIYLMREDFVLTPVINNHKTYKLLIEVFSLYQLKTKGFEEYMEVIGTYNSDYGRRFTLIKDVYNRIANKKHGVILDKNIYHFLSNTHINNLFGDMFSFKDKNHLQFSREKDMEQIFNEVFQKHKIPYMIKKQARMPYGFVDFLFEGDDGVILLELKNKKVLRKDLYQLYDYWLSSGSNARKQTEKVMIGLDFDNHVLKLANYLGISCYKWDIHFVINNRVKIGLTPKIKSSKFDEIVKSISDDNELITYEVKLPDEDGVDLLNRYSGKIRQSIKLNKEIFEKVLDEELTGKSWRKNS